MTGVIYARYSSHNQREESIEQQIEECTHFADAENIKIIGIYADKAVSGKSDKRNEFQRLMRDAEKKKFDAVIAYKSNRIARNMLNALMYEQKLDNVGIKTFYAKEEFGNTASGRFALRTMMNVNQFYSENMAEDIKRGLMDNAADCKVNGSLPYGYMRGNDGKYAINEKEAEIVKEVFEKVAKGVPIIEIARSLNDRGLKTKKGNDWNKNSFHRMLSNRCYTGIYEYSGVTVENGVPRIIDDDLFNKANNRHKGNKGKAKKEDYLLTGKLFCGKCKDTMVGVSGTSRTGSIYHYYACQTARKNKCDKEHVQKEYIEKRIAEITRDYVLTDEFIGWIAEFAVKYQKEKILASGLPDLKAELSSKEKAMANMLKAIEDGLISEYVTDRIKTLETEIKSIKDRISKMSIAARPIDKNRIIYALSMFRSEDVDKKSYQKTLIRCFVKRIYLYDDNRITIEYNLGDDAISFDDDGSYIESTAPPNAFDTNLFVVMYQNYFSVTCDFRQHKRV